LDNAGLVGEGKRQEIEKLESSLASLNAEKHQLLGTLAELTERFAQVEKDVSIFFLLLLFLLLSQRFNHFCARTIGGATQVARRIFGH